MLPTPEMGAGSLHTLCGQLQQVINFNPSGMPLPDGDAAEAQTMKPDCNPKQPQQRKHPLQSREISYPEEVETAVRGGLGESMFSETADTSSDNSLSSERTQCVH